MSARTGATFGRTGGSELATSRRSDCYWGKARSARLGLPGGPSSLSYLPCPRPGEVQTGDTLEQEASCVHPKLEPNARRVALRPLR
jgi:hypothetical protein